MTKYLQINENDARKEFEYLHVINCQKHQETMLFPWGSYYFYFWSWSWNIKTKPGQLPAFFTGALMLWGCAKLQKLRGRQKCNAEYMPEASGTIRLVWAPGKGEKFCQSETEHPFPWDMSYPDSPSINGMFPSGSHHRNVAPAKAQIPVSGCWELGRCSCLGRLVRSGDCLLMTGFKRFLMKVFL